MTPEQLKRLAEIAGLKLSAVGELLRSGSRFYRTNNEGKRYPNPVIPVYDWQPHIRIEQAMMVAEKVTADMFELTLEKGRWFATFYFNLDTDNQTEVECENPTPAEAICAAALATIGETK